ncbi:hypothetical protein [Rubellimicrobium aerolatum]|uniref:Uncharacterized protein n=1 Tax=Rubellimicrobium aerolatum TaxID=490979 RepID=A0ABW0SAL6_9RHOB|nr:hypothetical protein [Rubellimicrobium aerolatum]MBP1805297.1 hypothetical protein [Rubellimicrobium aerolatum]
MRSTRLASALLLSALAVPALAQPALAQDVSFQLVNNSGLTLMEFHATPAIGGAESDDLLVASVMAPGEAGSVTIPGSAESCDQDLRFVFEDGSEMVDRLNVCATPSYTLNPA